MRIEVAQRIDLGHVTIFGEIAIAPVAGATVESIPPCGLGRTVTPCLLRSALLETGEVEVHSWLSDRRRVAQPPAAEPSTEQP